MNKKLRGTLCVALGATAWGFSGSCGQYLFTEKNFDPTLLTSIRMIFAGLILIAASAPKNHAKMRQMLKSPREILNLLIFGIFGLAFCQLTYLTAIKYTDAGTATALQCTGPVLIMLYVCLRSRKLPRLFEFLAVIFAVLGTFLIAVGDKPGTLSVSPQGLFWGLLAALAMTLYTVLPTGIAARWGSVLVSGFGLLFGGAAFALATAVWTRSFTPDTSTMLALLVMVVIGTVMSYTLYLQGVTDIGPVPASVLGSIEPVSAAVFAALWLKTSFSAMDIAGFALIISTVFLLAKKDKKKTQNEKT